jgi:hypothetical protein
MEDWETEGRIHSYELENRPYTEEELDLLQTGEIADYHDDDSNEFVGMSIPDYSDMI